VPGTVKAKLVYKLFMPPLKKFKIGFDLDGVIIDHTQNKILVAAEYGFKIQPWQIASQYLKHIIPPEIYHQLQDKIYGPLTLSAPIITGALTVLSEMKNMAGLFLISRRQSPLFRTTARKWLKTNLPGIFSAEKIFFVATDADKNAICKKLDIEAFFDDRLSVLGQLTSVAGRYWFNQHEAPGQVCPTGITEIKSWSNFLLKMKRLSLTQPFE